ncbi:cyclin-like protein [Dunaliella salina]|uniref:Cyclin-like protein n=1 Tax=Dunaliella salina TaxID=3046 RepID=A0ABQ7H5E4_DUNSA|nr:cyclin-like protein [Dunaliella salina]|eukprot:KAF5842078.1 cyclin-like protein [Dunaliella salina]
MLNPQLQDEAKGLNQQQIHQIKAFYTSCMWELAKSMRLRSRVAATATAYFRKFYTRNSLCSWDPQLVHVGCLYLASKAEESSIAAITLVGYTKRMLPAWPFDITHVLDSEMVILQSLDFRLALLSPFQPLAALATDSGVPQQTAHRCMLLWRSWR